MRGCEVFALVLGVGCWAGDTAGTEDVAVDAGDVLQDVTPNDCSCDDLWLLETADLPDGLARVDVDAQDGIAPLDADERKTPSQRLRGCLFRLYEQRGKNGDFEIFYRAQMERIIDAVKNKLT